LTANAVERMSLAVPKWTDQGEIRDGERIMADGDG
jgi:hypothetical protein